MSTFSHKLHERWALMECPEDKADCFMAGARAALLICAEDARVYGQMRTGFDPAVMTAGELRARAKEISCP